MALHAPPEEQTALVSVLREKVGNFTADCRGKLQHQLFER
jgi:hypothetical protein